MKKIIFLISIAILGLAGCSSSAAAEDDTLLFWGQFQGTDEQAINDIVDLYNETNGDHKDVVYESQPDIETKLITTMSAGTGPDVVLWDRFATITYADKGGFLPIDDYIAESGLDTSVYYEPTLQEMNVEGVQYGLPATVDSRVIFYNKDLFDAAGIEYPTEGWTWDDMYAAADQCKQIDEDGSLTVAGFDLHDPELFNHWLAQAGGSMADEETFKSTFNNEAGKAVLDEWQKYLDAGIYKNGFIGGSSSIENPFAAGQVCMEYDGPWMLPTLYDQNVNFGTVTAPVGPGGDNPVVMGGFGLAIPSSSSDPEEAYNFMQWWTTTPEVGEMFYEEAGQLPANKEIIQSDKIQEDENIQIITSQFDHAFIRPQIKGYSSMIDQAVNPTLNQFLAGEIDAQEALDQAQEQADAILAEENKE